MANNPGPMQAQSLTFSSADSFIIIRRDSITKKLEIYSSPDLDASQHPDQCLDVALTYMKMCAQSVASKLADRRISVPGGLHGAN